MTTAPTLETVPTPAPTAPPPRLAPCPRIVRTAALALLIGGPASMALHVLWRSATARPSSTSTVSCSV